MGADEENMSFANDATRFSAYSIAYSIALRPQQLLQEQMDKFLDPYRRLQEQMDKYLEPHRRFQEQMDKFLDPQRRLQEQIGKYLEPHCRLQEQMAKYLESQCQIQKQVNKYFLPLNQYLSDPLMDSVYINEDGTFSVGDEFVSAESISECIDNISVNYKTHIDFISHLIEWLGKLSTPARIVVIYLVLPYLISTIVNLTNKVRLCERSEPQSEPFVGQAPRPVQRWPKNTEM